MTAKVGNTTAQKHGGGAAELRIQRGEPFTGLAVQQEARVTDELETTDLVEVYKVRATRLQVVADLYYAAILGAGNLDDLDKLVQRFGWLQASALRAWLELRKMQKDSDRDVINLDELREKYGNGNS